MPETPGQKTAQSSAVQSNAASSFVFVYGTLRADIQHPLHALIRENARDLGPAVMQGRLYDFGAYPGVVDSQNPDELVYGEVYKILFNADLVFERLDAYEECGPDFTQPTEYLREIRTVRFIPATTAKIRSDNLDAWVYMYNHSLDRASHLEHGDYLKKNSR